MSGPEVVLAAILYIVLGRAVVQLRAAWVDSAFAALNLAAVYYFFFWGRDPRFTTLFTCFSIGYVLMVCLQYLAMRWWSERPGNWPWLAFYTPILFLVGVRYAPFLSGSRFISRSIYEVLLRHPEVNLNWVFVGLSYLAFRTSYLVLEVRNHTVPRPSFAQYMGFAFFLPTLWVGPINKYSLHRAGFSREVPLKLPVGRALSRIVVGAVKFRFLGPILNTMTYSGLLLDGHPHKWIDLPIAAGIYYLYLYCNFSGFCDIAIGASGLIGIPVAENFDSPFAARNMREFWNRWHITLSQWMRDVVFSPLSRLLVRILGSEKANHAIAMTIFVVFLFIGIWHGIGWNYAVFGVAQAVGVVAAHYYSIALKARLRKEDFAAYNRSPIVRSVAVGMTQIYFMVTLLFFANDATAIKQIFEMLRIR